MYSQNISKQRYACHPGQAYFRLHETDTVARRLAVPPVYYKLQLSQKPDTTNKPVVYGYIDMKSGDYFDKRNSLQPAQHAEMKFYFRSQYKKLTTDRRKREILLG